MSKLSGKVAVVTGASKGIGAAVAKALAAEGAAVVVNYASSQEGADAVVGVIEQAGGKAVAVKGDVSKAADAQAIVETAIKAFGRLDILVKQLRASMNFRRWATSPRRSSTGCSTSTCLACC
ncbi:MAG: SDR family NAD(P)-dependent oxidoreductase [Caulobacteraceae bacterium]